MSNKENLLLRIKAVQALDQLYYQKGEHLYSHRRVWRNHARRIFGINYTTYASYLRRDVSHLPDQPEVAATSRICPISRRWPRRFAVWMKSSISRIRRGETGEAYPADAS